MRSAWKHLENQLFWIGKTSHWPVVLDGRNGKMLLWRGKDIWPVQKSSLISFNKFLQVPVCQVLLPGRIEFLCPSVQHHRRSVNLNATEFLNGGWRRNRSSIPSQVSSKQKVFGLTLQRQRNKTLPEVQQKHIWWPASEGRRPVNTKHWDHAVCSAGAPSLCLLASRQTTNIPTDTGHLIQVLLGLPYPLWLPCCLSCPSLPVNNSVLHKDKNSSPPFKATHASNACVCNVWSVS